MEKELDDIAEGEDDYFDAIDHFIKKFQPLLDEANEKMEVIAPKKTGEKCPECGHDLVERHGRYGKFVACENYPECKYIKKEKVEPEYTGETCPKCGSPMVFKTGRYGKFEACSNYPECKYIKNSRKKAEPVMKCVLIVDHLSLLKKDVGVSLKLAQIIQNVKQLLSRTFVLLF